MATIGTFLMKFLIFVLKTPLFILSFVKTWITTMIGLFIFLILFKCIVAAVAQTGIESTNLIDQDYILVILASMVLSIFGTFYDFKKD